MYDRKFPCFLLILSLLLFIQSSGVFAEDGGFTIDIGEEIIIPDEEFGSKNSDFKETSDLLSGEVNYSFSYTLENEDAILTDLGDDRLFTLPEKTHEFDVMLNYTYFLQNNSRVFLDMNLTEKKVEDGVLDFIIKLREAFISHNFEESGNLILGKQKLNFGNGFGRTPTGIYSNSQIQEGVYSGRWSISTNGFNFTTVLIPPLADGSNIGQLYERVETNIKSLSIACSGHILEKKKPRLGLDLSTFIGDVEVYSGISARMENDRKYLKEDNLFTPWGDIKNYYFEKEEEDKVHLSGLLGVAYTWPETQTYILLELYHDSTGLSAEEIENYGEAANYCSEKYSDPLYDLMKDAFKGQLAEINSHFYPGVMSRNYLFMGVNGLKVMDDLTINLFGQLNLEDRSGVVNPEVKYSLNNNTSIVLGGNIFFGDENTEFGMSVIDKEITIKTVSLF